ncbi:MAG: FtsX-like permease family protein [Rhodospirillaceae bacterium]
MFRNYLAASLRKAVSAVGALIAIVALSNFINLMTARSARRAVEVGVRKAVGAHRRNLIAQFIGESLLYVGLGAGLAAALVQILLPSFNAFLQRAITFDLMNSPVLLLTVAGVTVLAGVLAGAYPAFVLSSFPPHATLKSSQASAVSTRLRQGLVICQFAILIGLGLGAVIVYQQTRFGMNENLRLTRDQVLLIQTACSDAFKDAVLEVPGVQAAACSSMTMMGAINGTPASLPDGTTVILSRAAADFGLLELYGRRPLAGRFFSRDRTADSASAYGRSGPQAPIVINEKLAHALGYATPDQAIGASVPWVNQPGSDGLEPRPSTVIGVVADFPVRSVTSPIEPMAFFVDRAQAQMLHVKISGDRVPETLDAIDKVWRQVGEPRPIRRRFFDQYVENMYRDIERQGTMLMAFTVLTVFIACLGLFGLAAFTAEQRTKEIGIRKAMGARTGDLLGLLLWQFTKPVLWANLIAWPAAYFIMRRWLEGFAYHIDLAPWMFLAASALAVVISLATVMGHALLVARAQPVTALRYD